MQKIQFSKDVTVFQYRAARRSLGLTLKEVAAACECAENSILGLERGNLLMPPVRSRIHTRAKAKAMYEMYGIVFYENNHIGLESANDTIQIRFVE